MFDCILNLKGVAVGQPSSRLCLDRASRSIGVAGLSLQKPVSVCLVKRHVDLGRGDFQVDDNVERVSHGRFRRLRATQPLEGKLELERGCAVA